MKSIATLGLALMMALSISSSTANAAGYLTGAVVGGVAGHYAGNHGLGCRGRLPHRPALRQKTRPRADDAGPLQHRKLSPVGQTVSGRQRYRPENLARRASAMPDARHGRVYG